MATLIRGAFPRHAAKAIEGGLKCTPAQAWRIVKTGQVPQRFRAALLRLVDDAIDRNEAELRRLREQRKLQEFANARAAADRVGETASCDP